MLERRHRTVLLGGLLVTELGSAATDVVVAWLVLEHTGSAALTGLVWATSSLAMLLGGPLGGYLADALPRRRTMIAADVIRCVLVAGLGVALLSGWFWLPAVLLVVFVQAFLMLTFEGSLQALIPAMAGDELEWFNGRVQAARLGGALIGPAVGGVLLAATSRPATALLIDAATYVVSAAVLLWLPLTEPERSPVSGMRGLFGGLEAIRSQPQLRRLTTLSISMAVMTPVLLLSLPLIARDLGAGGLGYGALSSAVVLGMAIGSLGGGLLAARFGPDGTIALGLAGAAGGVCLLAWSPAYGVALAASLAIGLVIGPVDVVFFSSFQRACPPEALGRAMTQVLSLISIVRAPSYALAGLAYTAIGTGPLLAASSLILVAGSGIYLVTAPSTEATELSSAGKL